jgi:hypothetical protein
LAKYNEIQVGRYNRYLQKLFSMKGPAALTQLSPEMMPVLPLFHGVENRYLEGWDRFGFSLFSAAVVGQLSAVRFRNPAGSNVIAVFELITCQSGPNAGPLSDQPFVAVNQNQNANLGTLNLANQSVLDKRSRPLSTLITSSGQQTGGGVAIIQTTYGANGFANFINYEHQQITVLPGTSLDVIGNVLNQAITPSAIWRERFLEDSERA